MRISDWSSDVCSSELQSQLLPAVLGSDSEILDWGRASRLFKSPQRMAAAHNHPTCQAEGCMVPSTWCEAHHRNPWSQGGRTDLGDLILLCPWHHHRVHDARSSVEFLANGDVRSDEHTSELQSLMRISY